MFVSGIFNNKGYISLKLSFDPKFNSYSWKFRLVESLIKLMFINDGMTWKSAKDLRDSKLDVWEFDSWCLLIVKSAQD